MRLQLCAGNLAPLHPAAPTNSAQKRKLAHSMCDTACCVPTASLSPGPCSCTAQAAQGPCPAHADKGARLASAFGDADYGVAARLQHALDVLEQPPLAVQHKGHLRDQARVHHACREPHLNLSATTTGKRYKQRHTHICKSAVADRDAHGVLQGTEERNRKVRKRARGKCARRTRGHGGLHGDEAGLAAHELDHADALERRCSLHLGRQQRALTLLHRRVKAEALVDLRRGRAWVRPWKRPGYRARRKLATPHTCRGQHITQMSIAKNVPKRPEKI